MPYIPLVEGEHVLKDHLKSLTRCKMSVTEVLILLTWASTGWYISFDKYYKRSDKFSADHFLVHVCGGYSRLSGSRHQQLVDYYSKR